MGHWRAHDLADTVVAGQPISDWHDTIGGIEATGNGEPIFSPGQAGGRAAIGFDPSDGADGLKVRSQDNPLNGKLDFTAFVTFSTSSSDLLGDQGGLVFAFRTSGLELTRVFIRLGNHDEFQRPGCRWTRGWLRVHAGISLFFGHGTQRWLTTHGGVRQEWLLDVAICRRPACRSTG